MPQSEFRIYLSIQGRPEWFMYKADCYSVAYNGNLDLTIYGLTI